MADGDERKRRMGPTLRTEFPLDRADRRQVKEWARRLAQQVADADSVEVTWDDGTADDPDRSTLQIVFRHPICPGRMPTDPYGDEGDEGDPGGGQPAPNA